MLFKGNVAIHVGDDDLVYATVLGGLPARRLERRADDGLLRGETRPG